VVFVNCNSVTIAGNNAGGYLFECVASLAAASFKVGDVCDNHGRGLPQLMPIFKSAQHPSVKQKLPVHCQEPLWLYVPATKVLSFKQNGGAG
jgi:hypothetical protein